MIITQDLFIVLKKYIGPSSDHRHTQTTQAKFYLHSLELATLRPDVDSPASIPRPSTPNLSITIHSSSPAARHKVEH
jgi:hypothetical protein